MRISVIVPYFNVERYVRCCLESLCAQQGLSGVELEVILINDGSTDGSRDIVHRFVDEVSADEMGRAPVSASSVSAPAVPTLSFVHHDQANAGLSVARNNGLARATGDYFFFLDSDDVLHPQCFARFLQVAAEHPDTLLVCQLQDFDAAFDQPAFERLVDKVSSIYRTQDEAIAELYERETLVPMTVACSKFYPARYRDCIHFAPGKLHEDVGLALDLLLASPAGIYRIDEPLYYYRSNSSSIMNTPSARHLDAVDFYDQHLKSLLAHYGEKDEHQAKVLACAAGFATLKTFMNYGGRLLKVYHGLSQQDKNQVDHALAVTKNIAVYLDKTRPVAYSRKDDLLLTAFLRAPQVSSRLYAGLLDLLKK